MTDPWPDHPEIPEIVDLSPSEDELAELESRPEYLRRESDYYRLYEKDSLENSAARHLRRQKLFRWAAQLLAHNLAMVPEVQRVAAFGAVAQPLRLENAPFHHYRRSGVQVLHQCRDVDLAISIPVDCMLQPLKKAVKNTISLLQETAYGGVAPQHLDLHLMDADTGK